MGPNAQRRITFWGSFTLIEFFTSIRLEVLHSWVTPIQLRFPPHHFTQVVIDYLHHTPNYGVVLLTPTWYGELFSRVTSWKKMKPFWELQSSFDLNFQIRPINPFFSCINRSWDSNFWGNRGFAKKYLQSQTSKFKFNFFYYHFGFRAKRSNIDAIADVVNKTR